jgi:hypothetical protein
MFTFSQFLSEETTGGGILHLEHPADRTFDGKHATEHALKTLKSVAAGDSPVVRKIDDKVSFQAIRTPEGKVGVKYKGTGSKYNFSAQQIQSQHGHKPYLTHPLKAVLAHIGKVLPDRPGEYQGGFMSTPDQRAHHDGEISHTPNTVQYSAPKDSEEGKKLAKSKVSMAVYSELKGPERTAHPILSQKEFKDNPEVHLVKHTLSSDERKISAGDKKEVGAHINAAEELLKDHSHEHHAGHEATLRTYINKTVTSGDTPSTEGYRKHLSDWHDKQIEKVKMEKTKTAKRADKSAALTHVDKNKTAFDKTFAIHNHVQQATNKLADALDKSGGGGFRSRIGGADSGGEGYVAGGTQPLKIVNRTKFSRANLENRARFQQQQQQQSII